MRKLMILGLLAILVTQIKAQNFCGDDVVENLTAEIQLTAMQVQLDWDFNTPITGNCGNVPCPPFPVLYEVQVQFGIEPLGGGVISWFPMENFKHLEVDTESEHGMSVPITRRFKHFRYRVQVNGCSNWDGWVTVSL